MWGTTWKNFQKQRSGSGAGRQKDPSTEVGKESKEKQGFFQSGQKNLDNSHCKSGWQLSLKEERECLLMRDQKKPEGKNWWLAFPPRGGKSGFLHQKTWQKWRILPSEQPLLFSNLHQTI